MNRPRPAADLPPPTTKMSEGWHSLHIYYKVDQAVLMQLSDQARGEGRDHVIRTLSEGDHLPARTQVSIVSGHKADIGLMMLDPDPLKIDAITQEIRNSAIGAALIPTYSFVSITEISEYVPSVEQYAERLTREGTAPGDPAFEAKVNAYRQRLPAMNKQRIYPEIPPFPVITFYPMNKARHPLANWYTEPFSSRSAMMAEHATSGIKFAGRVSQLITASTGFDDWEWGVTLWSRAPEHIKEIVYEMRFDTASAKYAEFGEFYVSYAASIEDALAHVRL
ncbi:MAG: heme-dependent peroxidase [Planctomycetaceae bacterium]|nr:heme-dependent peroxidase [Planctomycetaceae bacterium]